MLYEVYLQNRWSSNYRIVEIVEIVEDYDETRFRPIIRVNSSKEIKYYFIPFRWFHIQKNISVVSFTIIMIICNCARCFETRARCFKTRVCVVYCLFGHVIL